jgi:hypothetical protein
VRCSSLYSVSIRNLELLMFSRITYLRFVFVLLTMLSFWSTLSNIFDYKCSHAFLESVISVTHFFNTCSFENGLPFFGNFGQIQNLCYSFMYALLAFVISFGLCFVNSLSESGLVLLTIDRDSPVPCKTLCLFYSTLLSQAVYVSRVAYLRFGLLYWRYHCWITMPYSARNLEPFMFHENLLYRFAWL